MIFARILKRQLCLTAMSLIAIAVTCPSAGADESTRQVETAPRHGLAIVVGRIDPKIALDLLDTYAVVAVFSPDDAARDRCRGVFSKAGIYGRASARTWSGDHLPLADGIANRIHLGASHRIEKAEVLRVLTPGGRFSGEMTGVRDADSKLDEWTHALHDPGGTRRSGDAAVGPARYIHWVAGPPFGFKPLLVAGGKLVCMETYVRASNRVFDVRDVANGMLIWSKPISLAKGWSRPRWASNTAYSSSQTNAVAADSERLYAVTGPGAVAYDLADGKQVTTYKHQGAWQVFRHDRYVVTVGEEDVAVFAGRSGERLTTITGRPLDLRLAGNSAYFLDVKSTPYRLRAVRLDGAGDRWSMDTKSVWPEEMAPKFKGEPLRLCGVDKDLLLLWVGPDNRRGARWDGTRGKMLLALDATTGEQRWRYQPSGKEDIALGPVNNVALGPDGVYVVVHANVEIKKRGRKAKRPGHAAVMLDRKNGRELRRHTTTIINPQCQPAWAAPGIFTPRDHVLTTDTAELLGRPHIGTRAGCGSSTIVGHGMTFNGSHDCSCNGGYGVHPNMGVKAGRAKYARPIPGIDTDPAHPLVKGPAYGAVKQASDTAGWTQFLGDTQRTNTFPKKIDLPLKPRWTTTLPAQAGSEFQQFGFDGSQLTAATHNGKSAFLASPESHTVFALDLADGRVRWQFQADGPVDAPPTLVAGLAVFGSGDGWLYAVRADDGSLAWKRRLAPGPLLRPMFGQLCSAWPVQSSVLAVSDGHKHTIITQAGWYPFGKQRSYLFGLDPMTGDVRWQAVTGGGPWLLSLDRDGTLAGRDPFSGDTPKKHRRQPALAHTELSYWLTLTNPRYASRKSLYQSIWSHDDQGSTSAVMSNRSTLRQYTPEAFKKPGRPKPDQQKHVKGVTFHAMIRCGGVSVMSWTEAADQAKPRHCLGVIDAKSLELIAKQDLPAAPAFMGVIPLDDGLLVTFRDGKVVRYATTAE